MGALVLRGIRDDALLLVDVVPMIDVAADHPAFAAVFRAIVEAHDAERLRLAVSTVTIGEVLTELLAASNEVLVEL